MGITKRVKYNIRTMLELTQRTYIYKEGKVYVPTYVELQEISRKDPSILNKNYTLSRGNYLDSISNALGIQELKYNEQYFPTIKEFKEADYWDTSRWQGGWTSVFGYAVEYYYKIFNGIMEKMFIENGYLYNDELDEIIPENEKLKENWNEIKLNLCLLSNRYGSDEKIRQNSPEYSKDLARYLSMYIIYMSNLADVFGDNMLRNLKSLEEHINNTAYLNPTIREDFIIEETSLNEVFPRINAPEMYLLNINNYTELADLDKLVAEVDKYIEEIEYALESNVGILQSAQYRQEVISGYIQKAMIDKTQITSTTVNVDTLPLKAAFAAIRNDSKLADAYFKKVQEDNANNKIKSFKSATKLEIEKIMKEWWQIYKDKTGLSISVALDRINKVQLKMNEIGASLEYKLVSPTRMRLVINNNLIGQTNDVNQLKQVLSKAHNMLYKIMGYKLVAPNDSYNILNQYGFENYIFAHYDLPVYVKGK